MSIDPPFGFSPVPMSAGWDDPYEPPTTRWLPVSGGKPLFYPGELHLLYGRGGGGKTTLALLGCQSVARAGHKALFLDYEGTEDDTRFRLRQMGTTRKEAERVIYMKALDRMDGDVPAQLTRWLASQEVKLVVVDSLGRALAASDREESLNSDVIWFLSKMEPLRSSGAAICFIDHIGHLKADVELPSPRGASAKIDQVAAAYYVRQGRPWSKDTPGSAQVIPRKDRQGTTTEGCVAAVMHVTPSKKGMSVALTAPAPPKYPGVDDQDAAQVINDLLDDAAATRSKSAMAKAASRVLGTSASAVETALDQMISEGYVLAASSGNGSPTVLSRPSEERPAA